MSDGGDDPAALTLAGAPALTRPPAAGTRPYGPWGTDFPENDPTGIFAALTDGGWPLEDGTGPTARDWAAALAVAARLPRIFQLPAPDAPGLTFVGGTVEPALYGFEAHLFPAVSVSGRGTALEGAFLGCIGEAAEHLSRLEWGDEPFDASVGVPPNMTAESAASFRAGSTRDGALDWLPARRLGDDAVSAVPADACLIRGRGGPVPPSSGCAAGETPEQACLAAVLELVERDAGALWWYGGQPARPLAPETLIAGLGSLIEDTRQGATSRPTWFLDITTDLEIPVVAAVSTQPDGFGLACGLAARTHAAEAVHAAFLELCQMELSNRLVAMRLHRGGAGLLAPVERRHRERMETVDANQSPILSAYGIPRPWEEPAGAAAPRRRLDWIAARLDRRGIECFAVDLTRAVIGMPVVRALAPRLQSLPLRQTTRRLEDTMRQHEARSGHRHAADLI